MSTGCAPLDSALPEPADVLIVGTGMGGATLGYALARAGKRVLFCEKGKASWRPGSLRGAYAETFAGAADEPAYSSEILRDAGRWADEIEEGPVGKERRFVPFLGSGAGGSTALYGMVLERLFPEDFAPRRNHPAASESTLPETWPIRYEELDPYYALAERLYGVRGEADPCRREPRGALAPPVALSETGRELFDFFAAKGLHPYRLASASQDLPDCRGCQGFLCEKNCKNDSVRVCLQPALTGHGARLLEECEVLRIEASRSRVTGVLCRWRGRELTLRADLVILAAGALETPRLLLESAGPEWPNGLANESGMVGRNLMRHYSDLYAVFPRKKPRCPGNPKELSISDLYFSDGEKLGSFQSFGSLPPSDLIVADLERDLRDAGSRVRLWMFRLGKPLVKGFLEWVSRRCVILASILEDLPLAENRVLPAASLGGGGLRLRVEYRICEADRKRIRIFRKRIREILKPYRFLRIEQAENNRRLAHVCGTCRFGVDPKSSVLDGDNRTHGIENLYVVDSSFFPSSGGTNPGLTIAANALRVADRILERWAEKEAEVCQEALS